MKTLTALYDTREAAQAASEQLVALGIADEDITIRASDGSVAPAGEERGFWSELKDLFIPDEDKYVYEEGVRRGGHLLMARVPAELETAAHDVLDSVEPLDLDAQSRSWRESGWQGYQPDAGAAATATRPTYDAGGVARGGYEAGGVAGGSFEARDRLAGTGDDEVIQVAEERLEVGKRQSGGGSVRVRSYVTERPVEEQVSLRQEKVTIERRPVDRTLASGEAAFKEKTIEAVERSEEAVIGKTAHVVEEIGLRKDVDSRTETVRDTVRRQEVEIEDGRTGTRLDTGETSASRTRDARKV
jgi:uncharacterized protein (TIGR02271 family)